MDNPEISGVEYQQGTLFGYEVREYLLEKWDRKCAYCEKENLPLQIEHIHPKSKGGSNRISNLCLACEKCNTKKGTKPIAQFLAKKPDLKGDQ
jgi:5-methylcytosine-specific restriction endonuclease McrA